MSWRLRRGGNSKASRSRSWWCFWLWRGCDVHRSLSRWLSRRFRRPGQGRNIRCNTKCSVTKSCQSKDKTISYHLVTFFLFLSRSLLLISISAVSSPDFASVCESRLSQYCESLRKPEAASSPSFRNTHTHITSKMAEIQAQVQALSEEFQKLQSGASFSALMLHIACPAKTTPRTPNGNLFTPKA